MELSEWTAAAVDRGESPPEPDEWADVEVPGSPGRFAGERAVAYRTRFEAPRGPRALLRLRGLYAHARVWLDGDLVGSHDTYFTPFETVFDPSEEHELVVECRAPEDRFGGVFETSFVPSEDGVPAIRWGATVESVPDVALTDITVRPDDTDETGINAIVTVDAGTDVDGRIRLSLHPEGADGASALSHVGVTASAGERVTVQGRLSVRDPDRWWPRGFGAQNRYIVRAALGESERTTKTGFRTVELGSEGLCVNGTRIPVRGRVLLPAENPDPTPEFVERVVETNASLVRWYGHAPPESVSDAADRMGVLVCHDVPMNSGALDVERARLVARRLAGEYGHHPSLALFGVHDDSHGFDATADEEDWRVLRTTGGGEHAATATAAATALSGDVPALAVPGLDAGSDEAADSWVVEGYSGADSALDGGAHTRYVVTGTDAAAATRAGRAVGALRRSEATFVTAFAPPEAAAVETSIATSFEPVKAFLDDPTVAEPRVMVVNDTTEPVTGDLDWSAGAEDGTFSVEVGAVSRATVGEIDAPPAGSTVELSVSVDGRRVETSYPR